MTNLANSDMTQTGELFANLVAIVAKLRSPGGCPWDGEQTHQSISRNMVEEAHEVLEAIESNDNISLCEELGDVMLQVVFHAQMAKEDATFNIDDVLRGITDKLIRRHPHVFGEEAALLAAERSLGADIAGDTGTAAKLPTANVEAITSSEQVLSLWDQIKLREKRHNNQKRALIGQKSSGLLDGVPKSLPALMQAQDISRKAVACGFDWADEQAIWEQVNNEIAEFHAEKSGSAAAEEEFGDVLFSLVNVARANAIDAESALRKACMKFRERWAIIEAYAAKQGKSAEDFTTEELECFWQQAKSELASKSAGCKCE